MNQADLINAIADAGDNDGVSKATIKWVLDTHGAVIKNVLATGEEAILPGLGKLTAETRAARKGRNPKTGEEMDIPAKRVPKFSAAKALKDAVA